MLKRMPGHLLSEWIAFSELEPFGKEWLQTGTITAMIANTHIDHSKYDWVEPEEFVPGYERPEPEPAEVAAKVDSYFTMMAAATPPARRDE